MMVPRGWCTSQPPWRIRPFRVHRPNRKAECAETCPLRLERGKGCKALPIATWVGAIPPGSPAGDSNIISLPNHVRSWSFSEQFRLQENFLNPLLHFFFKNFFLCIR
jgi:hypothetical protein